MASVYQGKYTFPVASTAERSIQQGAAAQAQMYAGLGQTLGKTFGDAIGKYFDVQDEKKAAESMADNQFANDIVYGPDRDVPADRKQRIKDIRGVMKAAGGFKNFLGRIETERANQRADRAEALNQLTAERMLEVHKQNVALGKQTAALRSYQIGAAEDDQTTREATQEFRQFLTSGEPGLTPRGEELTAGLARFDPRQVPGTKEFEEAEMPRADVIASAMTRELEGERKPVADMTSKELSNFLSKSNLSSEAKIAGLNRVEQLKAQEIEDLKLRSALATARSTAGYKELEEQRAATKAGQETTEFVQKQGQKDFSNTTIRGIDPSGNSIDVQLKGVVGNLPRADELREDIGKYNDAQAKIDEMLEWAKVRETNWLWMSDDDKSKASRLATSVQSAMRKEVLGAGVVTEPEYKRLQDVVPNPASFWTGRTNAMTQLNALKRIARDSFMVKLKGFGVTPAEGGASSVSTAARPSTSEVVIPGIEVTSVEEITEP